MGCDGKIMRRAMQRFEADRQQRRQRFLEREESIYRRQPRLREIDAQLRGTMSRIIASALRKGMDPQPALQALRDENLGLQREKAALLEKMGLLPDCLEEKPSCPLCGDTGYRNGQVCRCLRNYYAREQQKELSRLLDMTGQSFETFSLEWYSDDYNSNLGISPRKNMQWIFNTCRRYADHFGPDSGSLLLTGQPGLGKTFLSACIAREVSGEGWSVVYDTAAHVFERFETQKFGRDQGEADDDVTRILSCDLLILDDLGTEMTTAFVQSALYRIVNTRLMERRATIINTNIRSEELGDRYTPQIASRIEGEYQVLPFFGEDIRKLKRERS